MELEHNDVLKASTVTFKFAAFQSPSSLPQNMERLPKSLFFTFKFYTFQSVQTEAVHLRLTKQVEDGAEAEQDAEI